MKPETTKEILLPTKKTQPAKTLNDYISMFYGPPGIGKTTFVNDLADRVLFLSTDRGTRHMTSMRVEVHTYKDIRRVLKLLETSPHEYQVVAVDHADDLARMIENYVCEKLEVQSLGDAAWSKGWKMYSNEIFTFVQRILRLNIGVVFLAHEETKTIKTRTVELDRIQPSLSKAAWKVIVPMCDIIGYCGFRTVKKESKATEIRIVDTTPTEGRYAKDRTKRVKPEGRTWEHLDGKKFVTTFGQPKTKEQ